MLTNSPRISNAPKRDVLYRNLTYKNEKFGQNCSIFLGPLETESFRYLNNHVFPRQYFRNYLSYEAHPFFQHVENLMSVPEMQLKIHIQFLVF